MKMLKAIRPIIISGTASVAMMNPVRPHPLHVLSSDHHPHLVHRCSPCSVGPLPPFSRRGGGRSRGAGAPAARSAGAPPRRPPRPPAPRRGRHLDAATSAARRRPPAPPRPRPRDARRGTVELDRHPARPLPPLHLLQVPVQDLAAFEIRHTRSQRRSACSIRWVEKRIVVPLSRCSRTIDSSTS